MSAEHDTRRLGVLALGMFAIGTDGFVIAGVLPGIARGTDVTVAAAGLLVTTFALVYAVGAPLLTAAVARAERRAVLVAGMACSPPRMPSAPPRTATAGSWPRGWPRPWAPHCTHRSRWLQRFSSAGRLPVAAPSR